MIRIVKENFEIVFLHDFENIENGNEDIVILYKGQRYSATVFTLANIKSLMENYIISGECANGLYFYCPDMIIVENLKRSTILETVSSIIAAGEIDQAFKKIS
jgi:hypothetical protein